MAREVDVLARELGGRRSATRARAVRRPLPGPSTPGSAGASGHRTAASRSRPPVHALRGAAPGLPPISSTQRRRFPNRAGRLSDDEARALDDLIANLDRGDVVRCRYYEGGGYREAEGAVSQIDVTFRDLWIVRRRIPFSAIQSLELLYPAS